MNQAFKILAEGIGLNSNPEHITGGRNIIGGFNPYSFINFVFQNIVLGKHFSLFLQVSSMFCTLL